MKLVEIPKDELEALKRLAVENGENVRKLKAIYLGKMKHSGWLFLLSFILMVWCAFYAGALFMEGRWLFFVNFALASLNIWNTQSFLRSFALNWTSYRQCKLIESVTDEIMNANFDNCSVIALKKDLEYATDK